MKGETFRGHGRPPGGGVEGSGDGKQRVAHVFRLQSAQGHAVEPEIAGIHFFRVRVQRFAGHPVGRRRHEAPDQALERPAIRAKCACKVIQELGMRRGLAEDAKIVDGGDDAASKKVLPDAVDEHARGGGWRGPVRDRRVQVGPTRGPWGAVWGLRRLPESGAMRGDRSCPDYRG